MRSVWPAGSTDAGPWQADGAAVLAGPEAATPAFLAGFSVTAGAAGSAAEPGCDARAEPQPTAAAATIHTTTPAEMTCICTSRRQFESSCVSSAGHSPT